MGDSRAKVLGLTFALLAFSSILLIFKEETVGANAWALLALSGVFAAGTVMAFFQQEEGFSHPGSEGSQQIQGQQTEAQTLPDPAEAGFDVPVL
jgi:glucose uptake protein GlcU